MKKTTTTLLLLTCLLSLSSLTGINAQVYRNDKLKDQAIRSIGKHTDENDVYVVQIRYLNDTYSRHEFATKKESRLFIKKARLQQASVKIIYKQ